MSQRTAKADQAVRGAREREQQLVREGKGTRDWTPEQQRSILENGKAYDEYGKAFEGHHMKSAECHPEYQGDAGNIQFLTRTEHRDAHGGNFQNPTNGYYNPVTRVTTDFGDRPYIPCAIIDLSHPIAPLLLVEETAADSATLTDESTVPPSDAADQVVDIEPCSNSLAAIEELPVQAKVIPKKQITERNQPGFRLWTTVKRLSRKGKNWVIENPERAIVYAAKTVEGIWHITNNRRNRIKASVPSKRRTSHTTAKTSLSSSVSRMVASTVEASEKAPRSSPVQHLVKDHIRHRNGKEIHVASYQRGGKK